MIKLVEPPTAALVTMAFSNASLVRILDKVKSSFTISTIRRPDNCCMTFLRESAAGIDEKPGKVSPKASHMVPMVEAVPIVLQCPILLAAQISASCIASASKSCVFCFSLIIQLKDPEPIVSPLNLPFNIGPPGTTIVGKSTLHAPITVDGVVLSHPVKSTIPSSGFARMDSSVSILTKLRNSIVVGRMIVSHNDMTGNSIGKP